MYSGLTIFTKHSGALMGAHQKIDRVARRHLQPLFGTQDFPSAREILHFEGVNGPDGIKKKSPSKDEPWHYVDPFNENDVQLYDLLEDHYNSLVKSLKKHNKERVAFEAAWLAHALVDGLTPAHHYPYEEELSKLRGGAGLETRTTYRSKLIMPGDTRRQKAKNNWKFWGARGLLTTHFNFELGVATLISPLGFKDALPSQAEVDHVSKIGVSKYFQEVAREIAAMDMYHNFMKKGWTPKMAYQVRHHLGPALVKMVILTWYTAIKDAEKA